MSGPWMTLDPRTVYIAPSGKRCRWKPMPTAGDKGRFDAHAFFVYCDVKSLDDRAGFNLTPGNFRLLRKEASGGAAR